MNSPPLISVIIPTLEEEKLIAGTLDQFTQELKQRHQVEVIVSDGGSTDRTLSLAKSRADVVIERPPGSRQNIAIGRNLGARVARGEILIFFNADVLIADLDAFLTRMKDILCHNNVSGATCNVLIYPQQERMMDRLFHNFFNRYFWLLNVVGMGMGRGECHVIRKKMFECVGQYNEGLAAGEDYELFVRLRQLGKVNFVRTLTVFESPRRYRKFGYLWVTLLWFLNAVSVVLFRRSIVGEWKPVR